MFRVVSLNLQSGILKKIKFNATIPIKLPAFSPTMTEGKIVSWNVKEGQNVQEGQSIALIETDKATIDFELNDQMFIAKILKDGNDGKLSVGEVIAYGVDT